MNGRFQKQGGKNWFLPKEMNANRFFWDSHWLEIWSKHFYPSMGPNGGSVAMDLVHHGKTENIDKRSPGAQSSYYFCQNEILYSERVNGLLSKIV
jgi:hypothetical protein